MKRWDLKNTDVFLFPSFRGKTQQTNKQKKNRKKINNPFIAPYTNRKKVLFSNRESTACSTAPNSFVIDCKSLVLFSHYCYFVTFKNRLFILVHSGFQKLVFPFMKLLRPGMNWLLCLNILWYKRALIFARILNFSSIAVNGNFLLMFHWSNSIGCWINMEDVPKVLMDILSAFWRLFRAGKNINISPPGALGLVKLSSLGELRHAGMFTEV